MVIIVLFQLMGFLELKTVITLAIKQKYRLFVLILMHLLYFISKYAAVIVPKYGIGVLLLQEYLQSFISNFALSLT